MPVSPAPMPRRPRGAKPTPRHRLATAMPYQWATTPPPTVWRLPTRLSYWLNDTHGDCVTAEEAFAKACDLPSIFIRDDTVRSWAIANGVLEGAYIPDVLTAMSASGFRQDGDVYCDGGATAVDWTNMRTLRSAISVGPVKLGVAADHLEAAVPTTPRNGWFGTGFTVDAAEDHCVSLCGYGTLDSLAQQFGVSVPNGVDPSLPGYQLFTWSSVGIIDHASMVAITSEAWLRQPTTVIH
jgi:hypothetical protein